MSNKQTQQNNADSGNKSFVAKVRAFFGKFRFRRKKNDETSFESLNVWEQAELAERQANAQAEALRVAEEVEKQAKIVADNAVNALSDTEKAEIESLNSDELQTAQIDKKSKGNALTAKDHAISALQAAQKAKLETKAQADKLKTAEQKLMDAQAVVSQAAVNWEEFRKEAAERMSDEYKIVESEAKEAELVLATENVGIAADEVHADSEQASSEHMGETVIRYKEMSPTRMVFRRFFRSRLSMVGLIMLVVLFLFSFLGPPILHVCGYQWYETTMDESATPERAIMLVTMEDANGDKVETYQIIEKEVNENKYASPSADHLLGTDQFAMDVFVRLMYGGRISLTLGFVVVILETIFGVLLGGLAGYFGGWVDQVIMRIVDILNCIPTLPILLIFSVVLQSWQIPAQSNIYFLMIILTIFGWSGTARLVRGQILYLREQEYIVACEVMGIPTWRRIFRHLLPNIMPQLIVSMTLGLGSIILYESTLSYLGLGIPKPYAAWGTMISSATDQTTLVSYPNLWIPAGILIIIAVLGFNFVGDGLRDAMDPKSKR